MKTGNISNHFEGVAAKRLSSVEADPRVSNQHEFNGVAALKKLFGSSKQTLRTNFVYLGMDEEETLLSDGFLTWYDAREAHPNRSEYRLYFPSNDVTDKASEDDLVVIAKGVDGNVLVVIVCKGTTYENQILWLFGINDDLSLFTVRDYSKDGNRELGFAGRLILEELGIEIEGADESWLERIINKFGVEFPKTKIFSEFARETLIDVSPVEDPDKALLAWMEHEEMLFRTLERHMVNKRLENGFEDTDDFIKYSLSVQNRRKSRVGHALENHIEQVLVKNQVRYSRGKETENRSKPDFLFPGIDEYHNATYPESNLTMLGVKSTCKDRWRQVLTEAARIERKHLFTLEPGISEPQTGEMKANLLQLVLPADLHASYSTTQQPWLMSLGNFITLVRSRQR